MANKGLKGKVGGKRGPAIKADFTALTRYITEKQLAQIIMKSVHAIQQDRARGVGVDYIVYGGKVLYDMHVVHKYMKDHTVKVQK